MKDDYNEEEALFKQLKVPFKEDKEAVWERLSEQTTKASTMAKVRTLPWGKMVAAAVLLLVCTATFCTFYTRTIDCAEGQHVAHLLPDGSEVTLNAASSLSYAPYAWSFQRAVHLEGEAFFEVEKGSRFTVFSALGQTSVLGTSFNIFARESAYRVFCATGKVQVNASNESVILTPNELAILKEKAILKKQSNVASKAVVGWLNNKFNFNKVVATAVFKEIERQYNVRIDASQVPNVPYSGGFEKSNDIEITLEVICTGLNLQFENVNNRQYRILSK